MTQFIDDLKKSFGLIKKQTDDLGALVTSIRDRIMLLEAEHSTILDRPLCKEEMLEVFLARLDESAKSGDASWVGYYLEEAHGRHQAGRLARRISVATIRQVKNGVASELDDSWLNYGNLTGSRFTPLTAEGVFSLFREPIKDAIRRHFDQIVDWPFPDALPAAEYFPRLDEIEKELGDLREQEATFVSEATRLGVTLPKPYDFGASRWD